ncbi:MAG: amidase, partial [Spirochaetota bacterium]
NPTGHNIHHGHTRNPYHPDHDTGGSSSGPATAVAAGLAPIALGADGGGSIRVPAAHCGLVGLKPTFGRVSATGAAPVALTVGHLGPLGATVADVALAYAVMAGPDPDDPHSLAQPPVSIEGWNRGRLDGVRLGIFRPWFEHADEEVVARCDEAVRSLVGAGAEVRAIELPGLDALRAAHAVTILSEMATFAARHPERRGDFAPATRISLALARSFTATDYLQAQRVRRRAMQTFLRAYETVDAIVTPSSAVPAPRIPDDGLPAGISDLGTVTEIMRYAIPGNMLGFPAVSVPAGVTSDGLPVGLQAMAAHWREDLLLGLANVVEAGAERPAPTVKWDLLRA